MNQTFGQTPVLPLSKLQLEAMATRDPQLAGPRSANPCTALASRSWRRTFGEVHKAIHREKEHTVALKRILMHNEKEGMPVTALREIKILKALKHPCIIDIYDMFVVRSQGKESPLSVYMVFPYMDHDLAGLLENERVKLSPSQIKLYMKQLLEGTEYMHRNHILHRDMKAANLLISNDGCLKIADFGLARAFDPDIVRHKEDVRGRERKYTNCVVTRWYRPPELLLGARQYGGEVDMWGVGCVLGEMFFRKPILPGASDLDQLDKIWKLCGSPSLQNWPEYDSLPGCEGVKAFGYYPRRLRQTYESIGPETVDLLDKLLVCNPRERLTASQALDHDYFWTDPLPADPKTCVVFTLHTWLRMLTEEVCIYVSFVRSLPTYEASHEFDKRGAASPAGSLYGSNAGVGGEEELSRERRGGADVRVQPAVEVEVHEGLEGATRADERVPHRLEARHDRRESVLHGWVPLRPRWEELHQGWDWRGVQHVQPAPL
ncbi:hypothetical protein NUW54_g9160 [Trametes sanguinea]|uniref:Uncharacterized protein n=1 Tax=Trametes sanguinea TaxID=158606 RepID=A0ACC1P9B1_9APHY|nr:hypothetical protein NUW54_g9160 [Trametes sanguinea]